MVITTHSMLRVNWLSLLLAIETWAQPFMGRLDAWATQYLRMPPWFYALVERAASSGVASEAELRFLVLLLSAYLFSLGYRFTPFSWARHLLSVYVGASMGHAFCGVTGWLFPLLACLISYGMMLALGPRRARHAVFVFNLVFLLALHAYRQLTDPHGWQLDATFMQMIVTQKLSAVAYNYYDGSGANPALTTSQARLSAARLPSPLETLAFVYFPPSFLMGPTLEYRDWWQNVYELSPVDLSGESSSAHAETTPPPPPSPPRPLRKRPTVWQTLPAALQRLALSLLLLAVYRLDDMLLPVAALTDRAWLAARTHRNVLVNFLYMYVSFFGLRCKYYFGFKMAEGAMVMSGVGFNGYVLETSASAGGHRPSARWRPRFDRIRTMDVVGFELAGSMRDAADAWNKSTNQWLRRYVYDRLPRRHQLNLYGTFVVSAIWHGIAPGYYLFFVTSATLTSLGRRWRRLLQRRGWDQCIAHHRASRLLYDVLARVFTTAALNYFIISFVMLTWERSRQVWAVLNWWGHKLLAAYFGMSVVMGVLVGPPKSLAATKAPAVGAEDGQRVERGRSKAL
ncbi:hypothetical protein CDCA_CDCA01G0249 [Cyanidium caldarium]|uniref:Uncharacterized protein n=1 Tax=Cyanidium caldarium TaxID=2771 RepID=A0AAV9IPH4_CYACA|nr:hypothetical protein CDCA_CDCA01G0249 [Cyanidium caldarium]